MTEENENHTGKVVWFSHEKGYGFIIDDKLGIDVFCHYSKIDAPDGEYKGLDAGDMVSFNIFVVERGMKNKPQAKNVKVLRKASKKGYKDEA